MKKFFILCVLLSCYPCVSGAVDVGLGVTLESASSSGESMILIPVVLSSNVYIEPFYRGSSFKDKINIGPSGDEIRGNLSELGVGLFYRSPLKEKIDFYVGGRSGYVVQESSGKSVVRSNEEKLYGYSVAPTLGLQYQVAPRFWVSGEAYWNYSKVDGKRSDSLLGESERSEEVKGTGTRVVLRYLF